MARSDPLYFRIEVEFIRSPMWLSLSPSARCMYLFLYSHAVETRQEKFARPSKNVLAAGAGIRANQVERVLSELRVKYKLGSTNNIVDVDSATVTLHGVRRKHAKLKGWPDPYGEDTGGICPIVEKSRVENSNTLLRKEADASTVARNPQGEMMALIAEMYPSPWVPAAKSWAGKIWKRAKSKERAQTEIISILKELQPRLNVDVKRKDDFFRAANAKLYKPKNDELESRHRARMEDAPTKEDLMKALEGIGK